MKIGIVGLGYVGLVTAIVLSNEGNQTICVDIDENKLSKLNSGVPTLYEPGLADMLKENTEKMTFTKDYSLLKDCEAIFVAVPTPNKDGRINLEYVYSAVKSLKNHAPGVPVAVKSTVIPGTASEIYKETGVRVVSNPEFLREGSAINDTVHPERIVLGGDQAESVSVFKKIWKFTNAPVIETTNENAELIKYASNAFLATKISFINEMANLCERIPGCDVDIIAKGMGYDKRIAPYFLKAGLGFGGSCFPKDTQAIVSYSESLDAKLSLVDSAIKVNERRVGHNLDRVESKFGKINGKKVCVLGAAFKDNTDDIRSSKSYEIITESRSRGAEVVVYDPVITESPGLKMIEDPKKCIEESDIVMIATEWPSFNGLDFSSAKVVIDFRGILDTGKANMVVGKSE